MTRDQAEAYIHSKFRKGSTPGLYRTQALLAKMGNPERKLKFIHIAGTNGKGSTASMVASILTKAGYRTGLFTSPFIYRFNERLQIDGEQIADDHVAELITWLHPMVEQMDEQVTEFELVTCMGFEYFLRQNCDIVVLEVGMGGLKDATNVIGTPEVTYTDLYNEKNLDAFINKAGVPAAAYLLKDGGIFSVTKEGFVGGTTPSLIGGGVGIGADGKIDASGSGLGTVLAIDVAGRYTYYAIRL